MLTQGNWYSVILIFWIKGTRLWRNGFIPREGKYKMHLKGLVPESKIFKECGHVKRKQEPVGSYLHLPIWDNLSIMNEYWWKWTITMNSKKQSTGAYLFLQCFSSVQSLSTVWLCDPMDCSMPSFSVHHQLPELTQTHVHWVGDALQPSHPLSSPSPPAFNLSQHQGLFQWGSSSHQEAKVLEFQLQHQSFQWTPRTDLL